MSLNFVYNDFGVTSKDAIWLIVCSLIEVHQKVSEGAAVGSLSTMSLKSIDLLLKAEEAFPPESVWLPLRVILKIVVHTLVTEVHVLITPVGSGQLGLKH